MLKLFVTSMEMLKVSVFCKNCIKKVATVCVILLLISCILCVNCFADTTNQYNFSLMQADDFVAGSTYVYFGSSNIENYTFTQAKLVNVSGDSIFNKFNNQGWRNNISISSWSPQYYESFYTQDVVVQNEFYLPSIPVADEYYIAFTLCARLSMDKYTKPTEDTSILVNGLPFSPTQITENVRGNYYTFIINSEYFTSSSTLNITFNFGDWKSVIEYDDLGELSPNMMVTFNMSDVQVNTTMEANTAYLAEIKSALSATEEQSATASQYIDQAGQQAGQLEDLGDQLNSLDKPSTDEIGDLLDYDQYTGENGLQGYGDIFKSTFINNSLVSGMLFTSLSMALVGFIFFGKKA